MATFTKRVVDTNDNAVKAGSRWWANSLQLGKENYWGADYSYVRFTSVTIPRSAIITSAKLTIRPTSYSPYQYYLKIQGLAEDNAANFASDPSARPRTSAAVDWDRAGGFDTVLTDSVDFSSVVQEIVNRAGWASGNALAIVVGDDGTDNHTADVWDYADGASNAVLLTVTYSDPTSTYSKTKTVKYTVKRTPSAITKGLRYYIGQNYGIKISKEGYDAKYTTPFQDVFTSKKGVLGKRLIETKTYTTNASGIITATYSHGLGYTPLPLIFVTARGGQVIRVPSTYQTGWTVGGVDEILEEQFNYYVNATTTGIQVYAHHYEPVMGGLDTPLASQSYTFRIVYYFNEMSTEI